MSEDLFERDLRALLARRDPGPAPSSLVRRVETDRETASRRFRGLPGGLMWVGSAAVTAVVALALLMALWQRPVSTGPGASPTPSTAGQTLQAGDGVADGNFVPLAQAAFGLFVLSILVRTALKARSRPLSLAATVAAIAVIWVAANVGHSDALVHESGISGVLPPSSEQDDQPGTFLGVKGNVSFHVLLTVTNTSRLPLELRGFVAVPVPPGIPQLGPRFVGLGMFPDQQMAALEDARPFQPTRIEPGGMLDLVLLGMAGECALPLPPTRPNGEAGGGFSSITTVDLVYDQLSFVHTEAVVLRDPVNVWWPDQCPSDLIGPSASPAP
jgi:hypothetical protein